MRIRTRSAAVGCVLAVTVEFLGASQSAPASRQPAPARPAAPTTRAQVPATPRALTDRLNDVDALGALFQDPEARGPFYRDLLSFSKRNLKLAIQGEYDADLLVASHAQADGQGRVFRIRKGTLSHEVSSVAPRRGALQLDRLGRLFPANEAEAFAMGLSFFITSASFASPTVLRYIVVSDPSSTGPPNWAHVLTEMVDKSGPEPMSITNYVTSGFNSSPAAQTRGVMLRTPFTDQTTGYLSIGWMSPVGLFQLESNEIDLQAAWRAAPPQGNPR